MQKERDSCAKEAKRATEGTNKPNRDCASTNKASAEERQQGNRCIQMNLQKVKRVRLKGKALSELNNKIYERDGGVCIICGRFVLPGTKFHHYRQGVNKEDAIDSGVLLCNECHHQVHFGEVKVFRQKIADYLDGLYGGKNVCLIKN